MSQRKMPLVFLVATMTGTAEALAEDLQSEFSAERTIAIRLLEDLDPTELPAMPLVLVISSTYGKGDVPETAEATFQGLKSSRSNLSGVVYGVVSLGDSSYGETFARGGEHWDAALSACGATRAGGLLKLDCQDGGDQLDRVRDWLTGWLAMIDGGAMVEAGSKAAGR